MKKMNLVGFGILVSAFSALASAAPAPAYICNVYQYGIKDNGEEIKRESLGVKLKLGKTETVQLADRKAFVKFRQAENGYVFSYQLYPNTTPVVNTSLIGASGVRVTKLAQEVEIVTVGRAGDDASVTMTCRAQ